MYTYDEIIASGYCVFQDELSPVIVSYFFALMKKFGQKLSRNEMKFDKLSEYFDFDGNKYTLKSDKTLEDIMPFVNPELLLIFQRIQINRNNNYEEKDSEKVIRK